MQGVIRKTTVAWEREGVGVSSPPRYGTGGAVTTGLAEQ